MADLEQRRVRRRASLIHRVDLQDILARLKRERNRRSLSADEEFMQVYELARGGASDVRLTVMPRLSGQAFVTRPVY
ncbi:MAG: hypothetical protein ACOCW3_05990 [Spirochaetota bacterium]